MRSNLIVVLSQPTAVATRYCRQTQSAYRYIFIEMEINQCTADVTDPLPRGVVGQAAVAKTTGSFLFFLRFTDNSDTRQNTSLSNRLVCNRNGSPVNLPVNVELKALNKAASQSVSAGRT